MFVSDGVEQRCLAFGIFGPCVGAAFNEEFRQLRLAGSRREVQRCLARV